MARARQPRAASASGRAGKAKSTKNGGKAAAGSATAVVSVSPQAGALTAGVQSRQRTQRKGSKASATTASSVSPFNDHGVTPEAHAASKTVVLTKSSQPHLSSAHIMGPQLPAIRQSDNTVVSQSSSPILPILPSPPPLTAPSTPSLNVASSTPRSKDDAGDAIASTGRKASSVHTQRTASLSSASALANAAAAAASLPPAWPTERSAESSAPFTTGEHMTRLEEVADMRRALQVPKTTAWQCLLPIIVATFDKKETWQLSTWCCQPRTMQNICTSTTKTLLVVLNILITRVPFIV